MQVVLCLLCLWLLSSCDNNDRMVRKFFKRLNAREVNAASTYIYPDDHAYLYVFYEQFLKNNKVSDFELIGTMNFEDSDSPNIVVKIKCNNCSEALTGFFNENYNMSPEEITDTLYIKTVDDKKCLTFNWKVKGCPEHLVKATVQKGPLNVRCGPGKDFAVISSLQVNDKIIVDDNYANPYWRRCMLFDKNCKIKYGYIAANLSEIEEISFFKLGWFEKIGLLVASFIALFVLLVLFVLLITTIFRKGGDNNCFAIALFFVIIFIFILTYQIIEGVVFEIFMINLPY